MPKITLEAYLVKKGLILGCMVPLNKQSRPKIGHHLIKIWPEKAAKNKQAS